MPTDKQEEAAARRRFRYLTGTLNQHGVLAGTGHRRIVFDKSKLPEEDLERLGFIRALIAVPESGQDRFSSYRHPDFNFHLHSHPGKWTMHEDAHPSATMLAHKATNKQQKAKAYVDGMPHILDEGVPGLKYYLKGLLLGGESTADRVARELSPEVKYRLARLKDRQEKVAEVRTELRPHQRRVVERLQREDQPGLLVAHGLGSGKTLTSIAAQDALGMPATVIVPAALQENYRKEQEKHLTDVPETETATLQRLGRSGGEGLQRPLLVVDEAHRAREVNTKAYKALRDDFRGAEKRMLLTASPFYNRPSDIAPLINLAAGANVLPNDPTEFKARYIREQTIDPGFMGRLRGIKPGTQKVLNPASARELREAFSKWVDYHPNSQEDFPAVTRETVQVPMHPEQLKIYDSLVGAAPAWVQYKIRKGLPPDKQESEQLNAFLTGIRQVSNSTRAYTDEKSKRYEPKIDAAFKRLQETMQKNPEARAVVYSNYLQSGLLPYKERLEASGIPYGEFTGELSKKERDQLVREYNEGLKKVLLLSSAGGEGLDLKGTRLIQMLDPHWNSEKLKQVEGRGIRYKSHEALPEKDRNVHVESYHAVRPKRTGLTGLILGKNTGGAADEYMSRLSTDKEKLIEQFKELMPGYTKTASISRGVYKGQPASPDTVKFKRDFQGITIHVDRPKGFMMLGVDAKGRRWARRYRYDYGYIAKTLGGDHDGLDVFVGPNKNANQAFWAVQRKPDGSFDEYKVFLGFDNRDEAIAAYRAHIPKALLGGMMVMRVGMMKAMLGINPQESMKTARLAIAS